MSDKPIDLPDNRRSLLELLAPESSFIWVVVIYGLAISVLTLAVPIAVQSLINTIANIGKATKMASARPICVIFILILKSTTKV